MILIDPITREEILLAKALGENVPDIVPVIRKEMYLAKIAGADIQTPEAITREEMYLDAIANGTELSLAPITRKEMFYAKALGLVENAPEPITKIENLLSQLTSGGGGGFDKYSWEGVFASIKAGTYATDYAIGDTVPLDLGSEGIINMQIAAFDADDLADGSGKAPISWISKNVLATKRRFNPSVASNSDGTYQEGTGMIGGWETSEIRAYLKNTIKPLIPENVRTAIKEVTKAQLAYDISNMYFTQTTADDVWIPNAKEVAGLAETGEYLYSELFSNNASRVKFISNGVSVQWILRTGFYSTQPYNHLVYSINTSGKAKTTYASDANGVVLCFCT